MYREHYGLQDDPFRLDPEAAYLYLSEKHRRARTFMEYSLFREGGFVVVTGDIGTGKTTLVEAFLAGLPPGVEVVRLARARLEPAELLQTLMIRFGLEPVESEARVACVDAITDHLEALYRRDEVALLVVDEAQSLGRDALEELRLLTEFGGGRGRRLHVLLVGQPELDELLDGPGMDPFLQRVRLRMHLGPLDAADMEAYIQHRLTVAGATEPLFDAAALAVIETYTGGVPRLINVLCDTALMVAYGTGQRYPDRHAVESAVAELGWRPFAERCHATAPLGGTEGAVRAVAERLETGLGELRDELSQTRAHLTELTRAIQGLAGAPAMPPELHDPIWTEAVGEGESEEPETDSELESGRGWLGWRRHREGP